MSKGSRNRISDKKKFDKNYYDAFGNTCIKCRKRKAAENKLYCSKCEEA